MRPTLRKTLAGAGAAAALGTAAVAVEPIIGPEINDTHIAQSAGIEVPTPEAEAAWWEIAVRERGAICGFDKTWNAGWGWYSHEIERWTYTYTSSKPFCRETGERLVNQERWPWVGQAGTIIR